MSDVDAHLAFWQPTLGTSLTFVSSGRLARQPELHALEGDGWPQ